MESRMKRAWSIKLDATGFTNVKSWIRADATICCQTQFTQPDFNPSRAGSQLNQRLTSALAPVFARGCKWIRLDLASLPVSFRPPEISRRTTAD
jgi:hypothetical protein